MTSGPATRARARRLAHLVARFFSSLRARPLDDATDAWVASTLEPAELGVWRLMGRADRAESVGVARRLQIALAGTPEAGDTRWLAAALLHDAGKQVTGYGTFGRVVATVTTMVVGGARVRAWATATGRAGESVSVRARMGRYVAHDDLGAELLECAGARPAVAAWAGAHHRPDRWGGTGIPPAVCRALATADGEPVRA